MNFLFKPLVTILITLSFFNSLEAQNQRDTYLLITLAKAECQRINGFFKPVLTVTTNDPYLNSLTYTISGGGLTTSLVLPASSGTFVPPASHTFIVPTLANGISYSVIATAPGKGSNTLSFTTNFGMCGGIVQLDTTDVTISLPKECPTKVNLVKNGSFFYGNDNSFQSNLPFGCNSCSAGSYCVGNQFSVKCNSWPANTWDNTLGTVAGNYMLVDGNPNSPSTVWRDTVEVCLGESYTFSFWIKSLYPDPFTLGMMINNITTPVFTTPAISGSSLWRQYSTTWVSTTSGNIQIGIRQLTAGHKRDFGIDDIFFGFCCECQSKEESSDCCQFGLRLFNDITNTIKTVRLTPFTPSVISNVFMDVDIDAANWNLINSGNGSYYDFVYKTGLIPANPSNLIDVDFNITLQPNTASTKIMVEWLDINNSTLKKEEINLICTSDQSTYGEDVEYDWLANTTQVSGSFTQAQVFSGAEQEPCDEPETDREDMSCGGISGVINCAGTNIALTVAVVPNATEYNWNVDGAIYSTTTPSLSASVSLAGQGSVSVYLEAGNYITVNVNGVDQQVYQSLCTDMASFQYCILSAEFTWATPEAICIGTTFQGWNVNFIPLGLCPNTYNYTWTFGDNGTLQGTGTLTSVTHKYATAGTYNVSLVVSDNNGCSATIINKLIISNTCSPDFHANYEWCESSAPNLNEKYPVTVTFTNKSNNFCNSSYKWDFGDPSSGAANILTVLNKSDVSHTYMAQPNSTFTVKLTMIDNPVCQSGTSVSHQIILKPVCDDLQLTACGDGIVEFSTSCPGKHKWDMPNAQALLYNPIFYCPSAMYPFEPFSALHPYLLNWFLGKLDLSIPQAFASLLSLNHFELKFADGALVSVGLTNSIDPNNYTTGTCTVRKEVIVDYNCCSNLKLQANESIPIGNKNYTLVKYLKIDQKDKYGSVSNPTSCLNLYTSNLIGERTKFVAKSKFVVWKKVKYTSILYTFPSRAQTITAKVIGDFRTKSSVCNCETIYPWNTGLSRYNTFRARYSLLGSQLYKTQENDIVRSMHLVKKGNTVYGPYYLSKQSGSCLLTNGY